MKDTIELNEQGYKIARAIGEAADQICSRLPFKRETVCEALRTMLIKLSLDKDAIIKGEL
jgi:hypothetical protein